MPPPPGAKGGGGTLHTRLRVREVGESQFGRLEKKHSTLSAFRVNQLMLRYNVPYPAQRAHERGIRAGLGRRNSCYPECDLPHNAHRQLEQLDCELVTQRNGVPEELFHQHYVSAFLSLYDLEEIYMTRDTLFAVVLFCLYPTSPARYTATKKNPVYVFPEKALRGLSPSFHSCVCERFMYSQDWSTYFPAAE